jgi:hypothetical protein
VVVCVSTDTLLPPEDCSERSPTVGWNCEAYSAEWITPWRRIKRLSYAAVAEINAMSSICSFDRDFDQISGIRRLEPPF